MPVESTKVSNPSFVSQQTTSFASVAKSNGLADMRSTLCAKSAKKKESDGGCLKCIADFFKAIWNFLCCTDSKKKKAKSDETEDSASSTEVTRADKHNPWVERDREKLCDTAKYILGHNLKYYFTLMNGEGRIKYTCIATVNGKCLPGLDGSKVHVMRDRSRLGNDDALDRSLDYAKTEYSRLIKAGLAKIPVNKSSTIVIHIALMGDMASEESRQLPMVMGSAIAEPGQVAGGGPIKTFAHIAAMDACHEIMGAFPSEQYPDFEAIRRNLTMMLNDNGLGEAGDP